MRMSYHELVGKRVVTTEGVRVGRVSDLAAEACGERLVVQALLVGPGGFLVRIGLNAKGRFAQSKSIPWSTVTRAGETIEVVPDWEAASSSAPNAGSGERERLPAGEAEERA